VEPVVFLAQAAVFATISGSLANSLAEFRIHQAAGCCFRKRRALAWRMATRLPIWT
jgi:hypothetical protein